MADFLFLLGVALCVFSVVAAIIAVLQTRAPRIAAILLVAGILLTGLAAWMQPGIVSVDQIGAAWGRVTG
ncbi:hypothetical protein [Paracoccus aerodenitrificans]|uniref:hypothetical protein n=1 Tax=Paracoccus aerodenitrificans TaxID=3017781 RepID=UPI0022F00699|nr:hypothetical protein [Paracoccus aerodenitrificans]WBU63004.1 hypothetical protein PAE61_11580 [Paracoccus aerodenitrificans]